MDRFIKVGTRADFEHKRFKCIKYLSRWIAVIKNPDDTFYAIDATCKHQNAFLLGEGYPKDDVVTCPRHGWQYNMRTGECFTESWATLAKFPLKFDKDDIYVGIAPTANPFADEDDSWI